MTTNPSSNPFLFSIITVTRNNRDGLKRTRKSIKSQSFQWLEWVIIDGASTDGTREDLEAERVWISEPDQGPYDAMNKGIAKAKGDYLLFLNAGDTLAGPHVLARIAAAIKAQQAMPEFIYGDAVELDFYKAARPPSQQNKGMFTHHQAMFYRRTALGGLRYDLQYKIAADYDFTCRFVRSIANILYCPMAICVFEAGGMSQQSAGTGRREQYAIRERLGIDPKENRFIYAAQSLAWTARKIAPGLYLRLRSLRSNRSGSLRA